MQTNLVSKKEPGNPVIRAFASFFILTIIIVSYIWARQYYSGRGFEGLGFGFLFVLVAIPLIPVAVLLAVNAIRRLHQQQNKTALEWVAYVAAYFSIIELLASATAVYLSIGR